MIRKVYVLTAMFMACASLALATKGPQNVANTIHNLSSSSTSPYNAVTNDEICVYCHTPHGGQYDSPLWNRADANPSLFPPEPWQYYNSATLSSQAKITGPINMESMLCMSCHDGSIAVNQVLNPPNRLGGAQPTTSGGDAKIIGETPDKFGRIGGVGKAFGAAWGLSGNKGNLTDDHPISFDMQSVIDSNPTEQLQTVGYAKDRGVRFYPVSGGSRIECGSCHDPHVDYVADSSYAPFLITNNNNSHLCLSCHDK